MMTKVNQNCKFSGKGVDMAVIIKNLNLHKPLSLTLNSGDSLLLGAGGQSGELREAEVENNPKVQKLLTQQSIALHATAKKTRPAAEAKPQKPVPNKAESKKAK